MSRREEGRSLGRRELFRHGAQGVLGAVTTIALAGAGIEQEQRAWAAGPHTVVLTPEQTEGPYFVEELLNRSDIRTDPTDKTVQPGHMLKLKVNVSRLNKDVVTPVTGAHVDIWHCNAGGVYSDEQQNRSAGKKFLRGYQVTDKDGGVEFTTIYPGWYNGRTVHIHAKVRIYADNKKTYEFNTQFYFDDKYTDKIYTESPYSTRGARDVRNERDQIFRGGGPRTGNAKGNGSEGDLLMLKLAEDGSHSVGTFNIVLDLSKPHTGGRGPGGPGGPGGFGPPPGPPPNL